MPCDPTTHPYRVAVYTESGAEPVRVFCCYKTERDAQAFADGLQAQKQRNGWTHRIVVE